MDKTTSKQINPLIRQRLKLTIIVVVLALFICVSFLILTRLNVSHSHVFLLFFTGIFALIISYMVLWTLGANVKYSRIVRILKRCYFAVVSIGLIWFIILQVLIISGSHTDYETKTDAVIVLGAGLINNRPSLILASRLNAAMEYSQKHKDIPIIVTGGLGQGQTVTEAEAMARYLIARGVDETQIWKEELSTNSHENINFALEIMQENGIDTENATVAIVSNEFHLYRAKIVAKKAGVEAIGVAAETPGFHRKLIYFFREAFSLTNEWVFR